MNIDRRTSGIIEPRTSNLEHQGFILGVNYWPIGRAMYMWQDPDAGQVERDFGRLAECGLFLIRVFLLWEEFQPAPEAISVPALRRLVHLADIAGRCGVSLLPTLFCGHMSGVNWLPGWVLGSPPLGSRREAGRFPVWSGGRQGPAEIVDWYADRDLIRAQRLQCREVGRALAGHPAVWAYDLGNESSNCVRPQDRNSARDWLEAMATELRLSDGRCRVTLGMHAEDLEEDRRLWPQDAGQWCDFLCMHGYPFYLSWVDDPLDARVLPFLGILTGWLGRKPVLFEEFGIPTYPALTPYPPAEELACYRCRLWPEDEAGRYYERSLALLRWTGMIGALAWCYGDYHPSLWRLTPLRENPHERHFGLFRHDGSPKPAVQAVQEFVRSLSGDRAAPVAPDPQAWLNDEDRDAFYGDPRSELPRLYRKFLSWLNEK